MNPVPDSAEVVIVGGGVIGVSIAYHLVRAGVRNVVLVERDQLGSGSSAKPLGGVRATFSDPGNIELGQRSLEAYERFASDFDTDIGLRQVGYLFLARTENEVEQLAQSAVVQCRHGGSTQMITPAEAARINPLLDPAVLLAASYSPRDGYAEPAAVVAGYAAAARALGAVILERTAVIGVSHAAGGIETVHTDRGDIATGALICATGAWSAELGSMVDVPLPVVPVRRQIGFSPQSDPAFPTVPFTLDLGTTLYFHNYPRGMLLGISNLDQDPGFGRESDTQWVPAFDAAAEIIAPALAGRPLEGGWAGLYENTPDHNAIIGASRALNGFFYATGFSGHGFLQAPAVGEAMADLYLGHQPVIDISGFDLERFGSLTHQLSEVHII